jgi:hypothetical protein
VVETEVDEIRVAFSDFLRRIGLRPRREDRFEAGERGAQTAHRQPSEATVVLGSPGAPPEPGAAPSPAPAEEAEASAPAKPTVIAPRAPLFEASQPPSMPEAPSGPGVEQPSAPHTPLQPAAGGEVDALAETRVVAAGGQPLGQVVGVVVAVEGELEGTVGPVVSGSNRLGRHPECEICLPSEWISRHHARIEYQHGRFMIEASSDKPTAVNSDPIDGCELHDGDYIKVGKTTLRFRSIL